MSGLPRQFSPGQLTILTIEQVIRIKRKHLINLCLICKNKINFT